MRKDLVFCAIWRDFNFFFIFRILGQSQEKCHFLLAPLFQSDKTRFVELNMYSQNLHFSLF